MASCLAVSLGLFVGSSNVLGRHLLRSWMAGRPSASDNLPTWYWARGGSSFSSGERCRDGGRGSSRYPCCWTLGLSFSLLSSRSGGWAKRLGSVATAAAPGGAVAAAAASGDGGVVAASRRTAGHRRRLLGCLSLSLEQTGEGRSEEADVCSMEVGVKVPHRAKWGCLCGPPGKRGGKVCGPPGKRL